ncbi:MAG: IPT/TIG domain-containing protein, partial [Promethearchaeia archaeon]
MASGGPGHARRPPSAADVRDENGHESGAHARCARRHSQARRWCGGGPAIFAFFCLGALPRMAGVQWDRASPFSVSAKGGDLLTITGAFETSATYECEFSPLEIGSSTVTSAAFAPEDSTKVVCTTPQWDRAAQRTRLRVLDQGTTQPIAGPGDPAAIITFTASWKGGKVDSPPSSFSASTGSAVGGSKIRIDGFGFDRDSSDYACIFVSKSDEQKVAQSVVPVKPGSSKALSCTTPRWPFDASGSAGVTKIYLEKGGQDIPFDSTTAESNREFQYMHRWEKISVAQGLSTYGSEVITVEGGGFKVGSEEYSCVLRFNAASIFVGLAATVLSSTRIQCISPHWKHKEAMTLLELYKDNCEGARGMHKDCDAGKLITKTTPGDAEFSFVQAARNLSVNFAEASNEGATMITVYGGGFDPDRNDYAVEWSFGNDTVIVNV